MSIWFLCLVFWILGIFSGIFFIILIALAYDKKNNGQLSKEDWKQE